MSNFFKVRNRNKIQKINNSITNCCTEEKIENLNEVGRKLKISIKDSDLLAQFINVLEYIKINMTYLNTGEYEISKYKNFIKIKKSNRKENETIVDLFTEHMNNLYADSIIDIVNLYNRNRINSIRSSS